MNKKKDKLTKNKQEKDIYINITAVSLIAITVIGYQKYGPIGIFLTSIISYLFGTSYSLVYCYIIVLAFYLVFFREKSLRIKKIHHCRTDFLSDISFIRSDSHK